MVKHFDVAINTLAAAALVHVLIHWLNCTYSTSCPSRGRFLFMIKGAMGQLFVVANSVSISDGSVDPNSAAASL